MVAIKLYIHRPLYLPSFVNKIYACVTFILAADHIMPFLLVVTADNSYVAIRMYV